MLFCLIVAIFSTIFWIDTLVITVTNAKVNPYQKSPDEEKIILKRTIIRIFNILVSSISWAGVIYFGINI